MTDPREHDCSPPALPPQLREIVQGYGWARNLVGESGGTVYRLQGKVGAPDLYLKHGRDAVAGDIIDEMARLRWLAGRLPVPEVRHFTADASAAWLLMTALPGRTAGQLLEAEPGAAPAIVDALAAFLRQLHGIPADDCPFAAELPYRLARGRKRIDAGLVDEDDFDDARIGWSAADVWQAMQPLLSLPRDRVVTHGDFSLDNILIADGAVTGVIDAGRVGIADRYQDLAILWNCLGDFGPPLQARLFTSYGIAAPDVQKIELHLMLDELF